MNLSPPKLTKSFHQITQEENFDHLNKDFGPSHVLWPFLLLPPRVILNPLFPLFGSFCLFNFRPCV